MLLLGCNQTVIFCTPHLVTPGPDSPSFHSHIVPLYFPQLDACSRSPSHLDDEGLSTLPAKNLAFSESALDSSNVTYGWSRLTLHSCTHLTHEFVASNNDTWCGVGLCRAAGDVFGSFHTCNSVATHMYIDDLSLHGLCSYMGKGCSRQSTCLFHYYLHLSTTTLLSFICSRE